MITVNDNSKGEVTILMCDRFTFEVHGEFRESYRHQPPGIHYIIDFTKTSYIDSSALGMLLLFKDQIDDSGTIRIMNCTNNDVYLILKLAKFDKLFQIDK